MSWDDFRARYVWGEKWGRKVKRATGVCLGDYERYFLVWYEDRHDPSVAIVCAKNESEAEEWFVEELDWSHLDELAVKDYEPDDLHFGPSGQPYDSEGVKVREVRLIHVELS